MRWPTCILAFTLVAGCSAAPDETRDGSQVTTADVAEPVPGAAPGIAVTAAPGVAFNYRYAFRLPAVRIAGAQEAHAQACEKLGVGRCRITGMRYTLTRNDQIDAMLAFKLDPTLARAFGRQGIAAIEAADGMLTNAEISGVDAGGAIDRITVERTRVAEDRARLDRELARANLSSVVRADLIRQRGELEAQERSAATRIAEQRDSLATTPMTFDYASGVAIRGFDASSPFTQAADTALSSLQWTLATVLGALALFGPPALVALLLFLLARRLGVRLPLRKRTHPAD